MLLKYFLLNTLLALSSVTAIPSPDTDNYDVGARDADDDPAGHLVDRADRYGCGMDATWKEKRRACVCKKQDEIYDEEVEKCCPKGKKWNGHRCEHDCGKDADWDRRKRQCVCKKRHARYGENKECKCPRDMREDRDQCRCKYDKVWDRHSQECKCKGDMFWNDRNKKCKCPKGKTFDQNSWKCKPRRHYD